MAEIIVTPKTFDAKHLQVVVNPQSVKTFDAKCIAK